MTYEGFPHICPMWHNHMWGDPHSTNSLSPCDCATYANMRKTLICHMTPIYLYMCVCVCVCVCARARRVCLYIYMYVCVCVCGPAQMRTRKSVRTENPHCD